jgi:hypothetical protein
MVLGNAEAIDAILKVKNMDSGMFFEFKRSDCCLNSDKSWFDR